MKQLVMVELNELNFELIQSYIQAGEKLPAFSNLIDSGIIHTYAEKKYELLEPWIQWVSVHTGKEFTDHSVFRLGDIIDCPAQQIFEKIESRGYKVGVFGAMNTDNRMKAPAYFVPDPWTQTPSDESLESRFLVDALRQVVNDNSSGHIAFTSALKFLYVGVRCLKLRTLLGLFISALKSFHKPWLRAIFLDEFLAKVHLSYFRRLQPHFSTVFFNAGAHVQHHYMHNSIVCNDISSKSPSWYCAASYDPVLDCLRVYDRILAEIMETPDIDYLIATGLTQKPYLRPMFYYRPRNHKEFFKSILNDECKVIPRMTRDSLLVFESEDQAVRCEELLRNTFIKDEALFGEVDRRGNELFVVLTYDREISPGDVAVSPNGHIDIFPQVVFVALKNGAHDTNGYAVASHGLRSLLLQSDTGHVSELNHVIDEYFAVA